MNDLKQREWPRGTNDIIGEISIDLLHSDFEKAAVKINEAIAKIQ